VEAGEIPRVGHNMFRQDNDQSRPVRVYRADPSVEQRRIEAVKELRRTRHDREVSRTLKVLRAAAAEPATSDNNLMPAIIEAVQAYATIGEMCDVFRDVWGEFKEPKVF